MNVKKRYCPSCGNKTNDFHCEICDRMTKATSERYKEKELNLIDDDIQLDIYDQSDSSKDMDSDFNGDKGNKERNDYYEAKKSIEFPMSKADSNSSMDRSNNVKSDSGDKESRDHYQEVEDIEQPTKREAHPYYTKTNASNFDKAKIKAILALFLIIFFIIVFLFNLFLNDDSEPSYHKGTKDESGLLNFDQYVTDIGSEDEVSCTIETTNGVSTVVLANETAHLMDGNLMIQGSEDMAQYLSMMPNSVYRYEVNETPARCTASDVYARYMEYSIPSINYVYVESSLLDTNAVQGKIILLEKADDQEIQALMVHLYACASGLNKPISHILIYQDEEKAEQMLQSVDLNYYAHTIQFHGENGATPIADITIEVD